MAKVSRSPFRLPAVVQPERRAIERWLREDVVPTYDEIMADPSARVSMQAAFAEVRARLRRRRRTSRFKKRLVGN